MVPQPRPETLMRHERRARERGDLTMSGGLRRSVDRARNMTEASMFRNDADRDSLAFQKGELHVSVAWMYA